MLGLSPFRSSPYCFLRKRFLNTSCVTQWGCSGKTNVRCHPLHRVLLCISPNTVPPGSRGDRRLKTRKVSLADRRYLLAEGNVGRTFKTPKAALFGPEQKHGKTPASRYRSCSDRGSAAWRSPGAAPSPLRKVWDTQAQSLPSRPLIPYARESASRGRLRGLPGTPVSESSKRRAGTPI